MTGDSAAMTDATKNNQEPATRVSTQVEAGISGSADTHKTWNPDELGQLIAESKALALYVARHGDSFSNNDQKLYDELLIAIANIELTCSPEDWRSLMSAYAKVTAVTYQQRGVNGRTILDTQTKRLFTTRNRPTIIGVVLFICALILESLMRWSGGVSDVTKLTGFQMFIFSQISALSSLLVPAFWGGLGGCIFLTKRISDKLFEMAYEEARMRGDVTRIFLGAMLGVVIVVLFFPNFGEQAKLGEITLAPATAAFIAGLGVKPVYAAFESLSQELARRFQGSRSKTK